MGLTPAALRYDELLQNNWSPFDARFKAVLKQDLKVKRLLQRDFLSRCYWTGRRWQDFKIQVYNTHPVLGVFKKHTSHPATMMARLMMLMTGFSMAVFSVAITMLIHNLCVEGTADDDTADPEDCDDTTTDDGLTQLILINLFNIPGTMYIFLVGYFANCTCAINRNCFGKLICYTLQWVLLLTFTAVPVIIAVFALYTSSQDPATEYFLPQCISSYLTSQFGFAVLGMFVKFNWTWRKQKKLRANKSQMVPLTPMADSKPQGAIVIHTSQVGLTMQEP